MKNVLLRRGDAGLLFRGVREETFLQVASPGVGGSQLSSPPPLSLGEGKPKPSKLQCGQVESGLGELHDPVEQQFLHLIPSLSIFFL